VAGLQPSHGCGALVGQLQLFVSCLPPLATPARPHPPQPPTFDQRPPLPSGGWSDGGADAWAPETDTLLCALVKQFGPNWALVGDALSGVVGSFQVRAAVGRAAASAARTPGPCCPRSQPAACAYPGHSPRSGAHRLSTCSPHNALRSRASSGAGTHAACATPCWTASPKRWEEAAAEFAGAISGLKGSSGLRRPNSCAAQAPGLRRCAPALNRATQGFCPPASEPAPSVACFFMGDMQVGLQGGGLGPALAPVCCIGLHLAPPLQRRALRRWSPQQRAPCVAPT
jgi:hypothetical protein